MLKHQSNSNSLLRIWNMVSSNSPHVGSVYWAGLCLRDTVKVTSRVDVHQEQGMWGVLGNLCSAWRKCLQASGNKCISVPRYPGTMLKDRRNNLLYPLPPPRFLVLEEMHCKRYGEHIKLFLSFFHITGHLPICRPSKSAGRGLHCSAATLHLVRMGLQLLPSACPREVVCGPTGSVLWQ